MGGAVFVFDRPVYYRRVGSLKNRSELLVYSIVLSSGRFYGSFVVVVVPVVEGGQSVSAEQEEQAVEATLHLYELMPRGWQQNCGYEGAPQHYMCGYDNIFDLLLRFVHVTHTTDQINMRC
uniref:Uncharacterized protein n=1 Tax=Minutocellus polymorphus TaxID=265543 RepID=A0A7S0ALV9_9STRA|mmetsp:Transcript_16744/g.27837  ORF Transcript_16744/g.27837 Transcript_16744/m.27837 type:complete len:121 (+) Transcript_16744:354-716(+)